MKVNKDDLEYIELFNSGYEGWVTLSSGKLVYISQPRSSAKETGLAMNKDNNIKRIEFSKTNFYKQNNQWIIGITVNKEIESYRNGDNYNKYEFNLWLGLIGLHMTIRNKIK